MVRLPSLSLICGTLLLATPALAVGRAPAPPAATCRAAVQRTALSAADAPDRCCAPGGACPRFLSTRALVRPPGTHAL